MKPDTSRMGVTLSLVSHTNAGKTTLARTLLRRDVGEVLDQAHVTEVAEEYVLIETGDAALRLWDTPGFGDSARLLARLRRHDQPLVWFFQQLWDRFRDRPLWCSQQAAVNIRHEADVVLYLLNATEEPEDAGYVMPELELLEWIGKPVVLVLNQTGDLAPESERMRLRLEVWQRHLQRFDVIRDAVALDAFSRSWVHERELFERLAEVLPPEGRPVMQQLAEAWNERNLHVFDHSLAAMATYLARTAGDREGLPNKKPSKSEKERAFEVLAKRLESHTEDLTATLLAAHDLEGEVREELEKEIDAFTVLGEDRIDPEKGALLGGVVSGALGGLTADLLAGGLTFGGGLLAGTILGALGGAGLARGYQVVTAGQRPAISWSPQFLDQLTARALLRYLTIAHFGRGRGRFQADDEPQRWRAAVRTALSADAESWSETWKSLARLAEVRPPEVRQSDLSPAVEMVRIWLGRAVRSSLAEIYPAAAGWLVEKESAGERVERV